MPIEYDKVDGLAPLKIQRPPLVPVEALAAIREVHLTAGDIPPGILRHFYERVLSLRCIGGDETGLKFSHARRQIFLARERTEPGQVGLIIRSFDEAMQRLRDTSVPYEILHGDGGMSRTLIVRDPAGNWIQLIETRNF